MQARRLSAVNLLYYISIYAHRQYFCIMRSTRTIYCIYDIYAFSQINVLFAISTEYRMLLVTLQKSPFFIFQCLSLSLSFSLPSPSNFWTGCVIFGVESKDSVREYICQLISHLASTLLPWLLTARVKIAKLVFETNMGTNSFDPELVSVGS